MKCFLGVLLFVIAAVNANTSKWLDFRVKFASTGAEADVKAFWKIHKTLDEAYSNGWVKVITDHDHDLITICKVGHDVRVCPLYDGHGFIAGMQLAVPPSDVEGKGVPYDLNNFPVYQKKLINGVDFWTSVYYLVDPEVVSSGGRVDATTIGEGLWLKSGNSFIEIPTDEESIKSNTSYTWQNCIPNMGKHYYYNMTPELNCEEFEPFFLMVQEGNIVGLGWQFFGKTQFVEYDWYDKINGAAVKMTAPLGPKCLSDGADEYGVISIHMYFVENPWTIPCNQTTDSVVPLPIP